jgi:hypothetical protein
MKCATKWSPSDCPGLLINNKKRELRDFGRLSHFLLLAQPLAATAVVTESQAKSKEK